MKDLSELLIDDGKRRETVMRQGKVTAVSGTSPRTATLLIDGTSYPNVPVADGVFPMVDGGAWFMDMGSGRWLIFATYGLSLKSNDDPGVVKLYAGSTAPSGWVFCDGQELAIATYPQLYAVLGTLYGALTNGSGGAGSTHFRVPNLKGRVPVHKDTGQTEFDVVGETGGAKTHTLATGEMPSHQHGGAVNAESQNHTHNGSTGNTVQSGGGGVAYLLNGSQGLSVFGPYNASTLGNQTATHTHTVNAEGGGSAHNNLQPYMVMPYIIKL